MKPASRYKKGLFDINLRIAAEQGGEQDAEDSWKGWGGCLCAYLQMSFSVGQERVVICDKSQKKVVILL